MVISPDTQRDQRIPPGQSQTHKWPVLDASGTPVIDMVKWRLDIFGLVHHEVSLTWEEFHALPRTQVFADFHCVTRWSRLNNTWTGVAVSTLLELAGGVKQEAKFVGALGYDYGWTTNLPIADFLSADALVAIEHDVALLASRQNDDRRLLADLGQRREHRALLLRAAAAQVLVPQIKMVKLDVHVEKSATPRNWSFASQGGSRRDS